MQMKVVQIGNSIGVVIPQSIRKETGIKPGDSVMVKTQQKDIIISPASEKLARGVDAKFAKMVDEFIQDHTDVLEKLAHR